jgi:hypothetical protein
MSDPHSPRRSKPGTQPGQRFTTRPAPPLSQPRPLAKDLDFADELPELRPRRTHSVLRASDEPAQRFGSQAYTRSASAPRPPIVEASANLRQARSIVARSASPHPVLPSIAYPSLFERIWHSPLLMILVGGLCLAIFVLASSPAETVISSYRAGPSAPASMTGGLVEQVLNLVAPQNDVQFNNLPPAVPGEHSVVGPPTIDARAVEAVLQQYNSPALDAGGQVWIDKGLKYGIDPAYALAFFIHESTAGTNPGWAGLKPGGGSTHNVGNIICAGYPTCYNRFRDYQNWDEGIDDWYKLIHSEYVNGRGAHTVEQIIPIYAPAFENDVSAYINTVVNMVDGWRSGKVGQ